MALNFNAAGTGRRVSHGSGAVIDNLASAANGMTVWAWVMRTSNGTNQHIVTKDNAAGTGWSFLCIAPGEGTLQFIAWRVPTLANYVTTAGVLALNVWTFVAVTYQDSLATEVDMYSGTLATRVAETGYTVTTNGAGAFNSDAAASLYAGNLQRVTTLPFLGLIARVGVLNRRLTLAELGVLQFATCRKANIAGTVLLADYFGTGTQPDLSGNLNNGTVTSATAADHSPLPFDLTPDAPLASASGDGGALLFRRRRR